MAKREVLTLNESTPQIVVPQVDDTYQFPRAIYLTTGEQISEVADGADAEAFVLQSPAYVTGGAEVLSIKNDVTEILAVDASGNITVSGTVDGRDIAADGALAEAFTGTIYVETVADQDYELSFDMPFAGTITTLRTKTQSGTCTVTGKINTTALGGTANSASPTAEEQTHASANTYSKGDTLKITVSANSSAADLEVAFLGTRS